MKLQELEVAVPLFVQKMLVQYVLFQDSALVERVMQQTLVLAG
jgi:hypothetical protein